VLERLIVRLPNWLGDTVMAVPALRALREGLPGTRVLLAGPWAGLLAGEGLGDVVVVYPRAWSGRLATADTVRAFDAATALLLPNSLESALAAVYWGARRRIGFAVGARGVLLRDPVPLPAPRLHQIDEYLLLAARLGVAAGAAEPRLRAPAPDAAVRREARRLLEEAGAPEGRARVGVHVGAAYGSAKVWARERIVEFCARVASTGRTAVVLGAARDAALAAEVAAGSGAVSLAGRDRAELLPALLVELEALVCGDTGVAHLAAALGTPVAALFGPTDPRLTAPRGAAAVVRHAVPCAPCFYRTCPIEHPCMRGIDAEAVARALDGLRAGIA